MSLLQSAALLRAYRWLPHAAINGAARRLARARRPRWLVQAAIASWVRRDGIDLSECAVSDRRGFASLEELFLRRLRPGARPFAPSGVAAPVDGRVVAAGALGPATTLPVKGERLSLGRIVNGPAPSGPGAAPPAIDLAPYAGGRYAVLFLSPRGYHRIHMPVDGELCDVRWHPGRFFPQNERALAHIAGVYEKNERAVLRLRRRGPPGGELLLVLVGASVVGGIELEAAPRERWLGPVPAPIGQAYRRGDEIAHFTFGSTVIVLVPGPEEGDGDGDGDGPGPEVGSDVRAGVRLWDDAPQFVAHR